MKICHNVLLYYTYIRDANNNNDNNNSIAQFLRLDFFQSTYNRDIITYLLTYIII